MEILFAILIIVIAIGLIVIARVRNVLKGEQLRKLMHLICILALGVWIFLFKTWIPSVIAMAIVMIILFPTFVFLEKSDKLDRFLMARKKGEIPLSLLAVGFMFMVVVIVCEVIFGSKLLALASIYAWGPGDAAAALIGKKFGRHKWGKDKKKSMEGSTAMFITSLISTGIILYLYAEGISAGIIGAIVVTALAAAVSELFSENGLDTIICPFSSMAVLLLMLHITGS